jgi:putative transcriptional regulator
MTANYAIDRGTLLLAEPFMYDPHFKRAVVLMCEHHPQGSLGFVLNKPTDLTVNEVMADFPPFDAKIYYGGPVSTDRLHFFHSLGDLINDSLQISAGVYWGGDFNELQFLIKNEMVLPEHVRFFVGHAGWSPGQLVEELEDGAWLTAEMHANYAFKTEPNNLWKQAMGNKGDSFGILADMPDEPILN